jgi:hypothetical protein
VLFCYLVFKDQAAVSSAADFAIYTISFPLSTSFFSIRALFLACSSRPVKGNVFIPNHLVQVKHIFY